jgi:hypothetical protein
MKAIKLFVFTAAIAAATSLQAQNAAPAPLPGAAGGAAPMGPGPMAPGPMTSGPMTPPNAGYDMGGAPAYGNGGYGGNGYGGDCYNGDCYGDQCGNFGCCLQNWCNACRVFSHCGRSYMTIEAVMLNRDNAFPLP